MVPVRSKAELAKSFEGACANLPINFEEIFSRALGNFEEQTRVKIQKFFLTLLKTYACET